MPATEPEDVASERALRASPVAPTVAFAVLGLVTVFAVGSLGLSQQPSATRDDAPPVVALQAPHLTLAGPPEGASAAVPSSLRLVPAGSPAAGSAAPGSDSVVSADVPRQTAEDGDTRAPAGGVRSGGERPSQGGGVDGVVVVGGGGGVAAELPGDGTPVKQPDDVPTVPPGKAKAPSSTPKPTPSPKPSPTPKPSPSPEPSPTPTSTPTPAPEAGPTPAPVSGPTPAPVQSQAPSQDAGIAPVDDTPPSSMVPSPPGSSAGQTHRAHAQDDEQPKDVEHGQDRQSDQGTDRTTPGKHTPSS